jgi:hypothetical protein
LEAAACKPPLVMVSFSAGWKSSWPHKLKAYVPIFLLARRDDSWQRASSLRVKKEFIFNPADGGQENLGRQRNGGCQFDRLPIRGYFCCLRQSLET